MTAGRGAGESKGPGTALAGKVAAITGAAAGNGRATALRLGQDGAHLYVSDINAAALEDLLTELRSRKISAAGGVYDASRVEDAPRFFADTVTNFGRLDVFVNNAGGIRAQPFPDVTEDTWDWTMDLNLKGAFFYMQEAARLMMGQKSGTIINIASVAGIAGGMTLSPPYAAAKAALINLTKVAAAKLAQYGVTVNAIAPGIVNTAFNWRLDDEIGVKQLGMKPGEHLKSRAAPVPLGRIGEPEDVANVAAFLADPRSNYITGETVIVAGGLVTQ
ncbi:MAG: SDR family oxidoreductase [Chloroflexi bacterium]|nr:SDR family oxidoreductase [Chloroflexota bacterium]